MSKNEKLVKAGDTILVDKEKVPKRILEASVHAANQMLATPRKPSSKPPSEKQLEARAKFTELARQRAAERKAAKVAVNPEELDEIPEGKVLIKAVPNKRPGRPRKVKEPAPPSESETEVVSASAASTPAPKPKPAPKPRKQPVPTETEESEPDGCLAVPMPRARKPAVPKAPKSLGSNRREQASQKKPARKPKSYYSETSETEAVSEESESEDEEMVKARVRKYAEKTKARLEALRQIESQLKPQNKYAGMSIF